MNNNYIKTTIAIAVILSLSAIFYIYIIKKTKKIEQNVKTVETFNLAPSGDSSSIFGVNLFGGEVNEIGGGATANTNETASEDRSFNKLTEVYNLPASAVSFLENKIIFTDRANGYSFTKENPESKNKRLKQNALSQVYNAFYGNKYILREILDDDLNVRYNLEKINDTDNSIVLDKEMFNCKLFENNLICLKKQDNVYSFIKINLDDENNLEEQNLYNTKFRHWDFDYINDRLFITQKSSAKTEVATMLIKDRKVEVLAQKVGLRAKISSDAKSLLLSYFDNGILKLEIKHIGENYTEKLPFASFADKCAWLKNAIICAVPKNLSEFKNPLDGWLKGKLHFDDEFFIYDTQNGIAKKVKFQDNRLPERFDAYRLSVSEDKSRIAFINKFNSKAWVISLAQEEKEPSQEKTDGQKEEKEEIDIKLKRDET